MVRRILVPLVIAAAAFSLGVPAAQAASAEQAAPSAVATPSQSSLLWCWDPYWGWYLCPLGG